MKSLNGYIIVSFTLLINLIGFLGVISVVFSLSDTIIAGVIAFLGAMLGGFITYLGVKLSLDYRDRELFLQSFNLKMHTISIFLKELRFIIGPKMFILNTLESERNMNQRFNMLLEFKERCERLLDDKRGDIDWEVVEIIDIRIKKFYTLKSDIILLRNGKHMLSSKQVFDDHLDNAQSILKILEDYKSDLMSKYRNLN